MADRNKSDSGTGQAQSPDQQIRVWYEDAESRTAKALEELVAKPSFGVLMAWSAENVAALTRISSDIFDLMLRNLRLAGRADITRLARQLHRTEDKLERVLQEVEALRDEQRRRDDALSANGREPASAPAREAAPANGREPAQREQAGTGQ